MILLLLNLTFTNLTRKIKSCDLTTVLHILYLGEIQLKKLCIYTKMTEADGAHFNEEEHVLSAALGGVHCLEKGIVSDEINSLFSKWEAQFLRYSPISILRQFYGPGKRGSLKPKDATKSVVNVYTPTDIDGEENLDDVGLCYVKLGVPYSIPALRISRGERLDLVVGTIAERDIFINCLKKCPESDFRTVPYDDMPVDTALLGFHDGKWHLARGSELELSNVIEVIRKIKNGTINAVSENEYESYYSSHQQLSFNEIAYSKVIAKFAFNFLAYTVGHDEILNSEFDPLRDWIISDLSSPVPVDRFVRSNPDDQELPLPELAHSITIIKKDKNLLGFVYLYGGIFRHVVLLSSRFERNFSTKIIVCDWKNKKEFGFGGRLGL